MEKEAETASEMVNLESSGGLHGFQETVYDNLGNFFGWLSTHQGLALLFIVIVLVAIVWLIMRVRKYRIQVKNEIYIKKKEIGKKDALIVEQEKKLADLQKKLSDQQTVASGAMLKTLSTLTGYDVDQLPIFFKSLSQISVNPLQMADPRAITTPAGQQLETEDDMVPRIGDTTDKAVSGEDLPVKDDAKEEIASGDHTSKEVDVKKETSASSDGPPEAAETQKTGE